MSLPLTILLLITAGVALVVQNLLMVRITETVSTILIALVINSAVGLISLTALLVLRKGPGGLMEAAAAVKAWALLPGLLGSFFVFAGVLGYQKIGAAPTIALLVASQLIAGLIADAIRSNDVAILPVIGAVLLVVGAILILQRSISG